ncbi:hypothetical protein [Edaphosphingomonas haloaromaticamans]|uniref:Uncharacterized protein n=1 Tax=Edaphosphingomonas haloaromaticamans TaxID=653954 RepID=A0A1S1H9D6_9SPHN|nr:hypothetical protein [Sphingomonas haloaromaticamans]OHT18789.1 hypothetical protein BHE75_00766 [Sphingomonas haloaromaticamans]
MLVGGAAVELYSSSAVNTGDFDIVTPRQQWFEEILQRQGFVKPAGPGMATRGWIHPDLKLGFEIVSSSLLDGLADRERILFLDFGTEGRAAIISVEDIIADRMGQFASGAAPEMWEQARSLLVLHSDLDRAYLDRRIREETGGDYGIADIEG